MYVCMCIKNAKQCRKKKKETKRLLETRNSQISRRVCKHDVPEHPEFRNELTRYIHRTIRPWSARKVDADPRPRMVGSRQGGCTGWHRTPRCRPVSRTALSSTLPGWGSRAFPQNLSAITRVHSHSKNKNADGDSRTEGLWGSGRYVREITFRALSFVVEANPHTRMANIISIAYFYTGPLHFTLTLPSDHTSLNDIQMYRKSIFKKRKK